MAVGLKCGFSLWLGLPHSMAASGSFSYTAAQGSKCRYSLDKAETELFFHFAKFYGS